MNSWLEPLNRKWLPLIRLIKSGHSRLPGRIQRGAIKVVEEQCGLGGPRHSGDTYDAEACEYSWRQIIGLFHRVLAVYSFCLRVSLNFLINSL